MNGDRQSGIETGFRVVSPLLAVAAFFWGIYTYRDNAQQQMKRVEAEAARTAETRRIEATRPFLDKQLPLYIEATEVAAKIATSLDADEIAKATRRFNELYYGALSLVEGKKVAQAMISFKAALDKRETEGLPGLALDLAHTCREELAASWGTDAWEMK